RLACLSFCSSTRRPPLRAPPFPYTTLFRSDRTRRGHDADRAGPAALLPPLWRDSAGLSRTGTGRIAGAGAGSGAGQFVMSTAAQIGRKARRERGEGPGVGQMHKKTILHAVG